MKVGFVHPDLGIGGAERLVVDAGVGLQTHGHQVQFFTSHHDPSHCFKETRDGTLSVRVYGDFLPRRLFGRFYALCAYLRSVYLALALLVTRQRFDVLFVDQISVSIPLLRFLRAPSGGRARILFYCHYPDKLLSAPSGRLKRLYRAPLDALEEWTTGCADRVLVNSLYTQGVFRSAFPRLARTMSVQVLYPGIQLAQFDALGSGDDKARAVVHELTSSWSFVILSINRFERKKGLMRAIEALPILRDLLGPEAFAGVGLVLAGGYDSRVVENVEHLRELREAAQALGVAPHVAFMCSFSEPERAALLHRADVVLYTPENEHFGIVPLEAMYSGRPVVACNSGGPRETVLHERTGLLCEHSARAFALALQRLYADPAERRRMGAAARTHAATFSLSAFAGALDRMVRDMAGGTFSTADAAAPAPAVAAAPALAAGARSVRAD